MQWEPGMGMIPDPRQIGDGVHPPGGPIHIPGPRTNRGWPGDADGDRGFRALAHMASTQGACRYVN
jgi:hypothetical protein